MNLKIRNIIIYAGTKTLTNNIHALKLVKTYVKGQSSFLRTKVIFAIVLF